MNERKIAGEDNNGWILYNFGDPIPDPGEYWVEWADGTIATLSIPPPEYDDCALYTAATFTQYAIAYQRIPEPKRRIY